MACNCREDDSSASLCAKLLVLLGPGPHQGGGHCSIYTLNCCHGAIVHCCKNMASDKMGVINQRGIQRKPRDICLPSGRHSCCHNFQLEWLILVTMLRSISGCQHCFYSSGRSKQNKKTHHLQFPFIILMSLKLIGSRDWSFCQKNTSAHSLKFKAMFPNVGARDRTAGFIILTTSQEL